MPENFKKIKAKREELGISLREASNETKIRVDYLKALEDGRFDYIEGSVFVKGFLKVYSNYLGLDTQVILEEYKNSQEPDDAEEVEQKSSVKEKLSDYIDEYQNKLLAGSVIVLSILVIVVVFFVSFKVYDFIVDFNNEVETASFNETSSKNINTSANNNFEGNNQNNSSEDKVEEEVVKPITKTNQEDNLENNSKDQLNKVPSQNKQELINLALKTIQDCWYSVEVDGNAVFKGNVKANHSKTFSGKEIKIKIGNAAGLKVINGDKVLGPFGAKGEVVTKIFSNK